MCEIKASLPFLKIEILITTFLRASWPVATFSWHYSVLALVACSVAGFLRTMHCSLFFILKKMGVIIWAYESDGSHSPLKIENIWN